MDDLTDKPILITGAARSGTSMIAGIIYICGAFKGDTSGPNKNNQKGMFENFHVRDKIVKPYLESIGADRLGQYPLPDINNLPVNPAFGRDIIEVMKSQGHKSGQWMYKGAKICLCWPTWQFAFPEAKIIIVRRKTPDIVSSCLKTSFMKAFHRQATLKEIGARNSREGWLWWVHQHERRMVEMCKAWNDVKFVWPERLIEGDYDQMRDTIQWLGLTWNQKEVMNFIEPKLWKTRQKLKIGATNG